MAMLHTHNHVQLFLRFMSKARKSWEFCWNFLYNFISISSATMLTQPHILFFQAFALLDAKRSHIQQLIHIFSFPTVHPALIKRCSMLPPNEELIICS